MDEVANVVEPVELVSDDGRWSFRPPDPAEADAALGLLSDAEVLLWNPAPGVVDRDSARAWCERGRDWASGGHATFSIVESASGLYAGNVSVFDLDLAQSVGSIGYRVAPAHRRQGAAAGALATVTGWAFRDIGLLRMQLFHAVGNTLSCRVAQRGGFALEGVLRSGSVYGDGRRHDEHLHARIASDP